VLSFRTMFDAEAARGFTAGYELRFGEDRFHADVAGDRIDIARGGADRPDAVIETDPVTLSGLVYDGRDLAEAVRSADLKVRGDTAAVERFLTLFSLPEPAPSA
jgi:ubiquinone biosynthesis protein UbiJ